MTLYDDKYRIESARLPGWNYASDGSYFLTICTYKSECFLGKIWNSKMKLSKQGEIVEEELIRSFEIRKELKCLSYVIMPNHLHLIVNLATPMSCLPKKPNPTTLKAKSISSFVGGFKSSATTRINTLRHSIGQKVWHPRFHDHIIRDSLEIDIISNYIAHNPATWEQDRFHQKMNSGLPSYNYPDN